MFSFYGISAPKNNPKNVAGSLNGFTILQICFFPLGWVNRNTFGKNISEAMLWRFPNIFKILVTFNAFPTQKTNKNHHASLKKV